MTAGTGRIPLMLVSAVDAALRTGLAGGGPEMVAAYPGAAAGAGIDLTFFTGDPDDTPWPQVTVLETGTF